MSRIKRIYGVALAMTLAAGAAMAQSGAAGVPPGSNPLARAASASLAAGGNTLRYPNPLRDKSRPLEFGAVMQGGIGLTDQRGGFKFLMAGAHAGKVLTGTLGKGALRGNFEYAAEAFPFWQSYTPRFQRGSCIALGGVPGAVTCSAPYTVGGTFTGVSITPIILRWNLIGTRRMSFWGQGAGGLLWTNHKYPAFGGAPYNLQNDGPNADASVWNFTPQGGIGMHYFVRPRRSVDLGANAIHISSASLGDRNPGVNASVQFTLGYTWWK